MQAPPAAGPALPATLLHSTDRSSLGTALAPNTAVDLVPSAIIVPWNAVHRIASAVAAPVLSGTGATPAATAPAQAAPPHTGKTMGFVAPVGIPPQVRPPPSAAAAPVQHGRRNRRIRPHPQHRHEDQRGKDQYGPHGPQRQVPQLADPPAKAVGVWAAGSLAALDERVRRGRQRGAKVPARQHGHRQGGNPHKAGKDHACQHGLALAGRPGLVLSPSSIFRKCPRGIWRGGRLPPTSTALLCLLDRQLDDGAVL